MAKSADAFRTISEVADWLATPAHVLRFWESKFTQIKPVKRAGGRRYYRPSDMQLLGGIKKLLHDDGITIKGVQKILREQGVRYVASLSEPLDEVTESEASDFVQSDLPAEDIQESAKVLSFQRDEDGSPGATAEPEKAEEVVSKRFSPDETDADDDPPVTVAQDAVITPDKAEEPEPALQDKSDAPPEPEEEEPAPAHASDPVEEDIEAPVMPGFRHRSEPMEPLSDNGAPTPADAPAPSVTPEPIAALDLPDDPGDDMVAPAGTLSVLAATRQPLTDAQMEMLRALAERLKSARA